MLPAGPRKRTTNGTFEILVTELASSPPFIRPLHADVILLQDLCLLHETREVCNARVAAAPAPAHEAFLFGTHRAYVARLAFCLIFAHVDCVRGRVLVFFVGMVYFGAAASLNLLAEFVVAAFFPVLLLAGLSAVACLAAAAFLGTGTKSGQWGSAARAGCEEHPLQADDSL